LRQFNGGGETHSALLIGKILKILLFLPLGAFYEETIFLVRLYLVPIADRSGVFNEYARN
jgi:hypothetical protein